MDKFIDQLPFFTAEHRNLATALDTFVEQEIEPRAIEEGDADARLREYVGMLGKIGFLEYAVALPGAKLESRAICLIRETLSYSSALADLAFVMQGLGTYAISQAASEHVRDFWISRAAKGKSVAAFALTEPDAGSDVASIKTTAERDGDTYIINGRKRFISNAGVADFYTVFARTGTEESGRTSLSAFVVGARVPGVTVVRIPMMGAHPIGEIEFNNCRVPAEDMVGAEGDGFLLAMRTLDMFRASVGAAACGMARRALNEAIGYAANRKQFGRLLAEHQLVQEKLADSITELDASRLLVYRAAYLKDTATGRVTRETSEAKLYATEAACRIIDHAVQIHGGSGLVRGSIVERLYRDIRALRIYEGTSEIQKLIIATQLMKE